jgi:hypothetical protein
MAYRPVPDPIKALRASLRAASEPALRDRLCEALRRLEQLYGCPVSPETAPDLDLKRRERFCRSAHHFTRTVGKNGYRVGGGDK